MKNDGGMRNSWKEKHSPQIPENSRRNTLLARGSNTDWHIARKRRAMLCERRLTARTRLVRHWATTLHVYTWLNRWARIRVRVRSTGNNRGGNCYRYFFFWSEWMRCVRRSGFESSGFRALVVIGPRGAAGIVAFEFSIAIRSNSRIYGEAFKIQTFWLKILSKNWGLLIMIFSKIEIS